jgi:general secretion pathway protein D
MWVPADWLRSRCYNRRFRMGLNSKGLLPSHNMRPGRVLLVLLIFLLSALPVSAESAGSLYKKGRDAEARQNYEAAFEYYNRAREKKPKDIKYAAALNRTRFLAAAAKVHRGQLLREMGKLDDALAEFEKAAAIDPSSPIAEQEIRRTREAMQPGRPTSQAQPPTQRKGTFTEMLEKAQGPVELAPISEQPITLKLTEDTRMIYETIGKLAGINVLFDPDYTSRRIRIELNGVTLDEALQVVAIQSKTFWRPVTSNTIFVAADTVSKRKELEQNVVKTFYLSNLSQPTELQDVVNAMRTILEINRIQQLPSQGAIVVRGTPDQVALAEKLIGDIDKAKSEVVVDVAVMQVRRDRLRDLGIKPPTSATVQLQPAGVTTTSTTGGTTTTTQPTLTFNTFKHLGSENYAVSIPAATVSLLFSDSTSKIIQNPQIRALDGQKASLKIGDRVPVATGSFQPGVGGLGGINPLVNTQFQYIDVGVNIDITPRVHANRDVTMKMMLDISSVTSRVNIGGIDQPVIGQRKIEHEIRLREGEVNLLGGILEETDVKSLSGIPGLGQIPLFRYFFSTEHKEKGENEIVFVLIPHVVRGQELSALNLKPLDVGTGTAIDLRRSRRSTQQGPGGGGGGGGLLPNQAAATAPVSAPPAPTSAAATVPPQPAPQAAPVQPNVPQPTGQGTQQAATAPNAAATAPSSATRPAQAGAGLTLRFDPAALTQPPGRTLALNVMVNSNDPLHTFAMQLKYDPKVLQLLNISNGGYLSRDGQAVAITHREDVDAGKLQVSAIRPPNTPGLTGEGPVLTLTFLTKGKGESSLTAVGLTPRDANGKPLAASATQAVIKVQ